jgi:hypothetical protein
MTIGEIGSWASTVGTVIAAAYAALTYHARKSATMAEPSAFTKAAARLVGLPTWRPVALVTLCAVIAWGAVLYGKFDQGNDLPDTYVPVGQLRLLFTSCRSIRNLCFGSRTTSS